MAVGGQELQEVPGWYHTVGTVLALSSGVFIGLSLILQKMGLLRTAKERSETGNEFTYLKSKLWWIGIVCCNWKFT